MTKPWRLALVGAIAYLLFALATIPADFVLGLALPEDVTVQSVRGTVWAGEADFLRVGQVVIPKVGWDTHPLALVTGRLSATINAELTDGRVQGRIGKSLFGSRYTGDDVKGVLPLALFGNALPTTGINGKLWVRLTRIEFRDGWPTELRGQATLDGLSVTVPAPLELGSFEIDLSRSDDGTLLGAFRDAEASVETTGTVVVVPGQYRVEGRARATAPGTLADALKFSGAPDAEGFYPLNVEGRF